MELIAIRAALEKSLLSVAADASIECEAPIEDNLNIMDIFDSMDIVSLIIDTESVLGQAFGKYIALADEHTFDQEHTPLSRFDSWVRFVIKKIEASDES